MGALDNYIVREATEADVPAILEIYNERVLNSTCLFIFDPVTLEDRLAWLEDSKKKGFPVIVAAEKDTNKAIAYASFGTFRSKPAYDLSVEVSLYIHLDHHRRGLGRLLLAELIRIAKNMQLRTMVASITGDNSASIALFEAFGFTLAGTFRDSGYKFGRFLDVAFYDLVLPDTKVETKVPKYKPFPWGTYEYKN